MKKITATDPLARSADLVVDNVERLRSFLPGAFTEGKIDFDVLRQLLGDAVDEREEKFGLTWHGKRQARQIALTPSTGTLRPRPEESLNWETTKNVVIEGDNLEVLKLLQKSYAGKVKLIYIDPPYNTGKEFVYPDDYRDNIRNYLELTGQLDGESRKWSSNSEASGRFHTDWLNMMYPRLHLARNLLHEDGAIFVSIDDNEEANLRALLNNVFGEENFVSGVVWQKRVSPANDAKWFSTDHDFVLVYAKNKASWRPAKLARTVAQLANYKNPDNDPRGPWNSATFTCNKTSDERPNLYYPITNPYTGALVWPKKTAVWKFTADVTAQQAADGRIYWGAEGTATTPRAKLFLSEMDNVVPRSVWSSDDAGSTQEATTELKELFAGQQVFDSPKPVRLIRRILELGGLQANDVVLDFFAGSGTTGHAVYEYASSPEAASVRFILVQLPEDAGGGKYGTIAEVLCERLRRAVTSLQKSKRGQGDLGFKVFHLATSNLVPWNPGAGDLGDLLTRATDNVLPDRTEQDLLVELMLKLGLPLTTPTETKKIAGRVVHAIGAGVLIACLAPKLRPSEIEALGLGIVAWHQELAPTGETMIVFRDSAFPDDVAKTNLTAILEQAGIQNVRSL